jgi:hypothetical protein
VVSKDLGVDRDGVAGGVRVGGGDLKGREKLGWK